MTEQHRLLIECYLSGQIDEARWQEHLKDEELRKAWEAFKERER